MDTQRPLASPELEATMRDFMALDHQVATLEEQLKDLKARRKDVGENQLTEVVTAEERHTGVRLSDGSEWIFERTVQCGILKADKPKAHQWLEEHGAGNLLKRYIVLSLGANSFQTAQTLRSAIAKILPQWEIGIKVGNTPDELVDAVKAILDAAGLTPTVEMEVETELPGATLSAFVRKSLKAGHNLPTEFGVYAPLRPVLVPAPAEVPANA